MITLAIVFLLGAFMNMYRGGLIPNPKIIPLQYDLVNAFVFAAMVGYFMAGFDFGYDFYLAFIWSLIMMLRWATPGWGEYFGAVIDNRRPTDPEVEYIDELIKPLLSRSVRLWGVAGVSVRMGEWGLFLGAPFMNFYPLLAGLLAGPLLYAISVIHKKHAWKIFEGIFGGFLWVAVIVGIG